MKPNAGKNPQRRIRIDRLLLERGLVESRQQARALCLAGKVLVDSRAVTKPGTLVRPDAEVRLRGAPPPYVSRGGLKLASALDAFGVDPRGKVAMDVGASTGGFTDCLLQRGAHRVFAVDVGYGQLAWKIAQDPRVSVLDRTNIRHLEADRLNEPIELVVVDVSFISLRLVLPKLAEILQPGGLIVALIKPQFEVGKGEVGKGGVVRDADKRAKAIQQVRATACSLGFVDGGIHDSPILGPKGNQETFVLLRKP